MKELKKSKRQLRQEFIANSKKELIDLLLEQIVKDYRSEDYTALHMLLEKVITNQNSSLFIDYLSEDKIEEYFKD